VLLWEVSQIVLVLPDGPQVTVKTVEAKKRESALVMTSPAPNLDMWKTWSRYLALPWKLHLYLSPHIQTSNMYTEPCPIIGETWHLAKITEGEIPLASTRR